MLKLVLIAAVIGFVLFGFWFTHFLEKKELLPHRIVTGILVFLIVLIPSILLPQLPMIVKQMLYGLSGILAIIFFETTRTMLETDRYKGIVKSENLKKKVD